MCAEPVEAIRRACCNCSEGPQTPVKGPQTPVKRTCCSETPVKRACCSETPSVESLVPIIADLQYQLRRYKETTAQQLLHITHTADQSTLRMLHVLEEVSLYKSHTQYKVEQLERRVGYLEKQLLSMSYTLENLSYTVRDRGNSFDEEESQSYGVEYHGEDEPEIHTAVKMRPKKAKSKDIEEEESIFSFDGWSKNKARNSMSVADAKENIPMGHVERMRHEVAAKNKARTKHLSVGVSMLPGDSSADTPAEDKRYSEPCRRAVEEDDFTISSISDIDLSPVGMSVEVKKRGDVSDDEF